MKSDCDDTAVYFLMDFLWENPTKLAFGVNTVQENMSQFVTRCSRVACIYDQLSVKDNTARSDVEAALSALDCVVLWEEGVRPSPEYDNLIEALPRVRDFQPDLLLAIGGGSTIDSAKVLSWAIQLTPGKDPARAIRRGVYPSETVPVGVVVTHPASGSWANPIFALYRRATQETLSGEYIYPTFSLLDPRYPMSLPIRQIRNSVCDALIHCIDQFATGVESPLFDMYWMSTMKELFEIGPLIVRESTLELHERLMTAATFALNYLFCLGKQPCWAMHFIGCPLTAVYGIDHAACVSLVAPVVLETKFRTRKASLAKATEFIWGMEGSVDEKARIFIEKLREFYTQVGMPQRLSEFENVKIGSGDVKKMTELVMDHMGGPFGVRGEMKQPTVLKIFKRVLI
jgi:alcohol dehydrogenase YqhD (iron-dependent ADH family)